MKKTQENIVQEQAADYAKAETDLLRDALKLSYTERFQMMTRLMKINRMLSSAVITHKPFPSNK